MFDIDKCPSLPTTQTREEQDKCEDAYFGDVMGRKERNQIECAMSDEESDAYTDQVWACMAATAARTNPVEFEKVNELYQKEQDEDEPSYMEPGIVCAEKVVGIMP